MPGMNLYITDEDRARGLFKEAARYIQFQERLSLSAYISRHLREYVRKAKLREKERPNGKFGK